MIQRAGAAHPEALLTYLALPVQPGRGQSALESLVSSAAELSSADMGVSPFPVFPQASYSHTWLNHAIQVRQALR